MLELTDLSRRFGDVVALDSVSFSVADGQIVGIVGPNGAGKTTAMRIALGVLEPARGEAATEALRMLDVLGVAGRARDRTDALSLGNQQRVQLAAALVHRPEALVLDEPFSGLDPVGVDVLSGVLRERAEAGVPSLFSSHQLDLVERLCESVVMINRGRIVAAGLIADLRSRDHRRLVRVEVLGAAPGWYATIPGARVLDHFPDGANQPGAAPRTSTRTSRRWSRERKSEIKPAATMRPRLIITTDSHRRSTRSS